MLREDRLTRPLLPLHNRIITHIPVNIHGKRNNSSGLLHVFVAHIQGVLQLVYLREGPTVTKISESVGDIPLSLPIRGNNNTLTILDCGCSLGASGAMRGAKWRGWGSIAANDILEEEEEIEIEEI